jgi:hypothetical protein
MVAVTMVKVRIVRMLVTQRGMFMPVRVRLRHGAVVTMLVMLIMDMAMLVRHGFVNMLVLVALGEMQPHPHTH